MEDPGDENEGTMATRVKHVPETLAEEQSNGSWHHEHSISISNGTLLCSCQPHILSPF